MDSQTHSPRLSPNDVEAVLTCKADWLKYSKIEASISKDLSIELFNELPAPDPFKLFIASGENLSHKQQSIQLFTLATILRLNFNADCLLWEYSRFQSQLKNDLLNQAMRQPVTPTPETGVGLVLDPAIQLHLHQAGFALTPQNENQTISNQQLRSFLAECALRMKVAA